MRSFRLKTVLLTILSSSVLLLTTGIFGWNWVNKQSLDALDIKIAIPGYRIVEYHGWGTDWKKFGYIVAIAVGRDWKTHHILKVRSNMYDRNTLYQSESWPDDLQELDSPDFDSLKDQFRMIKIDKNRGFVRYDLLADPHIYSIESEDSKWRMVALTNPEITLYIGINLDEYHADILRLRFLYFGSLILALCLIGAGAFVITTRALKPVNAIAKTAGKISSKDLSQRISDSERYDHEFDYLIQVVNEMLDRLESSFRQAMRFSSDASHELKTPLAIIQSELTTRLQKCEPGSDEQEALNHTLEEVQRLKRIIKNLYLLSQADAGKIPLSKAQYNLSKQLESFSRDTTFVAEEIGLKINTDIKPNIEVCADKLMFGQVIQNLINNSIRHNQDDGNGFVNWSLRCEEENVVFRIENSGASIPPNDQPMIFNRFFRASHHTGQKPDGLGLGLSLANEITQAHGGKLQLIKSDQQSTVFELILPKA